VVGVGRGGWKWLRMNGLGGLKNILILGERVWEGMAGVRKLLILLLSEADGICAGFCLETRARRGEIQADGRAAPHRRAHGL